MSCSRPIWRLSGDGGGTCGEASPPGIVREASFVLLLTPVYGSAVIALAVTIAWRLWSIAVTVSWAALATLAEAGEPVPLVRWHPYELNPSLPAEGVDRREYLERKFGERYLAYKRSVRRWI